METRSAKRKKMAQILENEAKIAIDRISDLPDAVLHHILSLLPIKTVAQMSVLSKRWKFLWTTFPDLDFRTIDPQAFSSRNLQSSDFETSGHPLASTMDFITQVLSIRDKDSDIRVLCFRARLSFSRLNSLIRSAVRHNVRELDIEVTPEVRTDEYFNFPRCFIGNKSLRVLKLRSGFRLPPSSIMRETFQYLHTLSLTLSPVDHQPSLSDLFTESSFPLLRNLHLELCFGLRILRVGCLALRDLSLERCINLHGLDVTGPKLERLRVSECFHGYHDDSHDKSWVRINAPKLESLLWQYNAVTDVTVFEHSNVLHEVSLGFILMMSKNDEVTMDKLQSARNFMAGLSCIRSLILDRKTIQIQKIITGMCSSPWLQMLSNSNFYIEPFYNLKSLELHTCFRKSNIEGLACLFRSSPTLHTLIVKIIDNNRTERKQWNKDMWIISSDEEEQYWESQISTMKSFLQHLKVVEIHGFLDCENEVALAKFLLKHGEALEEMVYVTGHCNTSSLRRQKVRSHIMMDFPWASSNAKVTFR